MNNFKDRLLSVLCGRKLYPWAASLGISRGAAESMNKGNIPGSEILTAIRRKENVCLTWLVSGEGKRYSVDMHDSDAEFAEKLKMHDIVGNKWNIAVIFDKTRLVVCLASPTTYIYKNKQIDYITYEVITGPVGFETQDVLLDCFERTKQIQYEPKSHWWFSIVDSKQLNLLIQGHIGSIAAFGDGPKFGQKIKVAPMLPIARLDGELEPMFRKLRLNIEEEADAQSENVASKELMQAVITLVEQTAQIEDIELSIEQKAKVYTAVYRHAQKKGMNHNQLDPDLAASVLDVI